MRDEFSKAVRLAAWRRCGGICECGCGQKILRAEYDHQTPLALNGLSTLENCQVLDSRCHRRKTSKKDVPAIAKSDRIEMKRAGLKRKGRPLPGTKASGISKRMDGTVVRREK